MRYYRDYSGRFGRMNPVTQFILVAAFIFALVFAIPRIVPYVATGLSCDAMLQTNLDPYNQSVLRATFAANRAYDPLRLEVVPDSTVTSVAQGIALNVRFINESMAPIQLFLVPESVIYRYNNEENGLLIFIQRIGGGGSLAEGASTNPPLIARRQYNTREIKVIPPLQRCTQRVVIPPERLSRLGVTPGQFRFVAYYRNTVAGTYTSFPDATQTPFPNQGVFTGTAQSNDVVITFG